MGLVLKILNMIPPGGWSYTQPENGMLIQGGNYAELRERVRQHRDNNRYQNGPQLDDEIQDQICERIPEPHRAHWCIDPASRTPSPVAYRSVAVADVRNFLHTLGSWIRSGFAFVNQPEADRRAKVCAECPKNVEIAGCTGCAHIGPLITQTIGHHATAEDYRLKGCEVCGCSNKAQIWVPMAVLAKGMNSHMKFPEWCWKHESHQ